MTAIAISVDEAEIVLGLALLLSDDLADDELALVARLSRFVEVQTAGLHHHDID